MNPQPAKPGKPDNHVDLVLKTTKGEASERFNPNNKIRVVLERAIDIFSLNPTPPSPYKVIRESDGSVLNLDSRIEDYRLSDGEVIVIRATRPTDG